MDAEPPRIAIVQPAPCPDSERAEDALRRALAAGRAPTSQWTVSLRVEKAPGSTLRGEGEITDEAGNSVAQRSIDTGSTECTSLARAVGVWASLVLDDEVQRAASRPEPEPPSVPPPPARPAVDWQGPAQAQEHPASDGQLAPRDEEQRSFEIGVATHLLEGTGVGAIAGASVFTVSEVGGGWFLRPSVSVGRTMTELVPASDLYATFGAGRFDGCRRMSGNYLERRGMQLDVCGGADLGFILFDTPSASSGAAAAGSSVRTTPFLALGPSLALRGELGSDLAVSIRGIAELNVVRESFTDSAGSLVDPSLFLGRAEIGVSWRLR